MNEIGSQTDQHDFNDDVDCSNQLPSDHLLGISNLQSLGHRLSYHVDALRSNTRPRMVELTIYSYDKDGYHHPQA